MADEANKEYIKENKNDKKALVKDLTIELKDKNYVKMNETFKGEMEKVFGGLLASVEVTFNK